MYKVKCNTGKGNRIVSALTKPYRPAQCRGDLSSSLTGGEKEQTEQQSEPLPNRVPRDLYHTDGTPDYEKASAWIGTVIARLEKQ